MEFQFKIVVVADGTDIPYIMMYTHDHVLYLQMQYFILFCIALYIGCSTLKDPVVDAFMLSSI